MKDYIYSAHKEETAILVGLTTEKQTEKKTEEYLDELEFLAETAGAKTVKRFTQKNSAAPRRYIRWFGQTRGDRQIYKGRSRRRTGNKHGDIR